MAEVQRLVSACHAWRRVGTSLAESSSARLLTFTSLATPLEAARRKGNAALEEYLLSKGAR